ncbi:MAG: hypothetical protein ACOZNI_09910 [Myxococcota bacterium]
MPLVSLLLTGCATMDAQVWGDYAIFLAAESSENIQNLEGEGRDFANPTVRENHGITGLFDCRDLSGLDDDAQRAERLDDDADGSVDGQFNYEARCCEESHDYVLDEETGEPVLDDEGNPVLDTENDPDGDPSTRNDCTAIEPAWFTWLDDQAYYTLDGAFEPGGETYAWRTEAVISAEGDLQLTFHIDYPRLGDLRAGWVIDPDFQPTACIDDGEGGADLVNVDGDWLEGWSSGEESGTLWHLNSGAYQLSPSDYTYWGLPQEWQAGAAFGRFEDEQLYGHAIDYDDAAETSDYPYGYQLYQPYYESYASRSTATFDYASDYDEWIAGIDTTLEGLTELGTVGGSALDVEFKVEDNSWRVPDYERSETDTSGFYDWTGVSVSWVRIKNPEDIAPHTETPVVGEFQIMLDGVASASKIFIRGDFVLENIREDVWGYSPTLEERKEDENGTPDCGTYRLTWEDGEE